MEKQKMGLVFTILFVLLICIGIFGVIYLKNNTKEYIVTFNSNGGSNVPSQTVKEGSLVAKPNNPVKEGYTFVEWQLNGKTYDFSKEVNSDLTLVAYYTVNVSPEIITYEVTFNNDGTLENVLVEEGKTVTIPSEPTKEGYNFLYWTLDNKEYDFNSLVTKDITLVAKWEKIEENKVTYTVTFDTDGGNKISTKTVEEGKAVSKPANPTKSGYTFVEWQLDGKTYNFNSKVIGNITLKAVWKEAQSYKICFDTNGAGTIPCQIVKDGQKAKKPTDPVKTGYKFDGWFVDHGVDDKYSFDNPVNRDLTLMAQYSQKNYTILVTKVDDYSPDRTLSVLEDGKSIAFTQINYSDGVMLCKGTNPTVSFSDLEGEISFKVVLTDGTVVTATLK